MTMLMNHCEGLNKKELLEIIQIITDDHEEEVEELKKERDGWKEIVEGYRGCFNEV